MQVVDKYPNVGSAELISQVLLASGLGQAELARRAGMPRSVLNAYLHGTRQPGADALVAVAAAAGYQLQLSRREAPVDAQRAGRILEQVLGLAEALPFRRSKTLDSRPVAEILGARQR